jgi:hypothetical protein
MYYQLYYIPLNVTLRVTFGRLRATAGYIHYIFYHPYRFDRVSGLIFYFFAPIRGLGPLWALKT